MAGVVPQSWGMDGVMTEWLFVLLLSLPSLCDTPRCQQAQGAIRAEIVTADEAHCLRVRRLLVREFGGEANMKGTVTPCVSRTPK